MSAKREWARRAARLELDSLSGIRSNAESWRTGLAGLTAIVLGAAFVKGPSDYRKLSDGAQDVVLISFPITVACLVVAALLAMRASYGSPEQIGTSGQELRKWSAKEAKNSAKLLSWAKMLTLVGVIGLGVMVIATWTSDAPAAVSTLTVTSTNGDTICGQPIDSIEGVIVITDAAGARVSIATTDIATLEFGACPAP